MTDNKFKEIVEKNLGTAVIFAGSDSDDKPKEEGKPSHIGKIVKSLNEYGIPYDVRICSAHKQPSALETYLQEYNDFRGALVLIAVAGGTDALSGTASFHSFHPVISCPPDAPNQSCLTNPPGSSNLYIANPANVGKAVAQMFSHLNPLYREILEKLNQDKIRALDLADAELSKKYRRDN
jgi:phosphoribosylaminoimidazole carboxylase PurE protein